MTALTGWDITEWVVAIAATATSVGVIWRKVVMPVRDFVRRFKAWMGEVESSVQAVKEQLEPNGGTTLLDKVNANAKAIARMDRNVQMLLQHDAERDRHGMRYGDEPTREEPHVQP